MKETTCVNVHIFRVGVDWLLDIKVDGIKQHHERCERTYVSPGDAITSARHAVNELVKKERK
jgi:hypothetical protein